MPTGWNERERAYEAKYAHDAEFRFLVQARRDRLFAEWAAGRLHLSTDAGAVLIREILAIPDKADHDEILLGRMADAFAAKGAEPKPGELAAKLAECGETARQRMIDKPRDPAQE